MKSTKSDNSENNNKKIDNLASHTESGTGEFMTTNTGLYINDDNNTLKAGERGPSLLEDFHYREKMTHFDHERIPERVVHARGAAAHGYFEAYDSSFSKYTKAKFLTDPSRKTPVFLRFSTVAGSRGSTDLARDVRGFAIKFYTEEGNFDMVGNNIPVFFIQDAIKFPDLIHAVKPEPHNEIPQAASAHDTFWDWVSLSPESMHMIMWVMSDRAIPRSYRMMQGFGVHTFRFINEEGKSTFVKFHFKPKLGVHSVAWDEAQKISGKDPDFHRRDLHEAIEAGAFPEWEFGVQLIPEEDELKYNFDLLDATKIIPEELVPVQPIGRLVLNRNPDNYFAETEQVAYHLGHVVPGIDFSNDPLLQGRLFSYTDTQLKRLGSPNFQEIPINRPINTVHNNQRDGHMRQQINKGKAAYHPNTMGGGYPEQAMASNGGYVSYPERVEGPKIRKRAKSFMDFFSQATLFYNSQSEAEKTHIMDALRFELGKVDMMDIRERVLVLLNKVDKTLAKGVAEGLGMEVPEPKYPLNHSYGADANPDDYQPDTRKPMVDKSDALSMANSPKDSIETRQIAFLAADGVDADSISTMKKALEDEKAVVRVIAPHAGFIKDSKGNQIMVDKSFLAFSSVLVDAVYIPGGEKSVAMLKDEPDAIHFINEAYRHCKAIAADAEGTELVKATYVNAKLKNGKPETGAPATAGVLFGEDKGTDKLAKEFIHAIAQHRFWEREKKDKIPA
ncbi:catalase [Mucilaginibacter robiniae]|uniref:Catalase n=1 Tax=Mucilaginibacter robiniae TaxID=2728022 RepID=A0A7L5E977_9SPHI|nr:catalase [Mucilaginibacter robiniae]QJD97433.1 catalase [Mucilaginibacter robiniae]